MDLATRQTIIDKIRAGTRAGVERVSGHKFESDELFEKYRLLSIRCIETMNDDRQLFLKTIDTGEIELVEVDVNRYLQVFDPIEVDND
jgi:hypothetical protein